MLRKGKIARLPRHLRHELNCRLADNQDGGVTLNWLNALPEVKAVLARDFGGEPIGKQNLYEWRQGGFVEWQARQDLLEQARDLAADAEELDAAANGKLLDGLATALSIRYSATLANWDGVDNEAIRGQLCILRSFTQDIVALRRCQPGAARLKIDQIPFEREEKKLADAAAQAKIDKERGDQAQRYLEEKWRLLKLAEAQAAAAAATRQPADRNVPLATPARPAAVHGRVERRRKMLRPMTSHVSALSSIVANGHQAIYSVSSAPAKIPYGEFSPVRLQTGCRAATFTGASAPAYRPLQPASGVHPLLSASA